MFKRPKYGNRKVALNGMEFDSAKERDRWIALKDAESKGIISNLERQVTYELIPKITEQVVVHKKTKDIVKEKFVQHPLTYTCDFAYMKDGNLVVEDVKASPKFIDETYKVKEKVFRYKFGFSIRRVYKATEEI